MADISKIKLPNGTTYDLALPFPRVTKDSHYLPGKNKIVFEEYSNGAAYNLPSNAWYHIYTAEGSDENYATQLALGMTVTGAYYRRYQSGTWTAWESLVNSEIQEENILWGGKSHAGGVSPMGMAISTEHNANRLAYINGDSLYFEYSSDSGSTWTNYGYSSAIKSQFCTLSYQVPIGRSSSSTNYSTSSRTRITLTAQNGTTGYVYTNPKKMLINISSSGGMQVLVEYRTGANYKSGGAWNTFGTYNLSGWSGWNDIPLILNTLGGGSTQTTNNWQLRLTFIMTSFSSSYPTTAFVQSIRIYGENGWTTTSNMAATGHLYSYDNSQNATFPAQVTASQFNGALNGNASTATKATQDESGNNIKATYASSFSISDHTITLKNKNGSSLGTVTVPDNNTTYTFANGTNGFTVTPSGGTAQTVTVTPSITNNVTGSGTSGYLAKFNGAHTITNGVALGSSTTTFLRNDGTWATPSTGTDTKNTAGSTNNTGKLFLVGALEQSANPQTYSNSGVSVKGNGELSSHTWSVKNSNDYSKAECYVDAEDGGRLNIYDENGIGRIKLVGSSGLTLNDSTDTATIFLDSEEGRVECEKMSVRDISDEYTFSKTSGNWSIQSHAAYRTGNIVHLEITFNGNGSAVSPGGNGFIGKIASGTLPFAIAKGISYVGAGEIIIQINTAGDIVCRVIASSITLSSSNTNLLSLMFIAND